MTTSVEGYTQESTKLSMTETIVNHDERSTSPRAATVTPLSLKFQTDSPPSETRTHCFETVPPENAHRCLILCFDGTGDQFDADNSNIVQLVSALKKNDRTKQMVYYQSGIGTYTSPNVASPIMAKVSLTLDSMIAWNLDAHVRSGYEFLMQNYTANDRICIFGFSRGAYIARSLAGMIHKVGLLPVDNHQQVPFAYKMYTRTDDVGWAESNAFKKAFSNDVHIDFIGVWDTVDSVGLIPRRLPFTTSNTIVRTFRHALSLDERRAKFKANLAKLPSDQEKNLRSPARPPTPPPRQTKSRDSDTFLRLPLLSESHQSSMDEEDDPKQIKLEKAYSDSHHHFTPQTDVLEVWFAGCHCDVGGGSVRNETRHSLARIPLRWMIRECFKANTGMLFDAQRLRELGLDPATLYPYVRPRPPPLPVSPGTKIESPRPRTSRLRRLFSRRRNPDVPAAEPPPHTTPSKLSEPKPHGLEEEEDLRDALSPMYDQLKIHRFWWILELIPMTFRYQHADDRWKTDFRPNLARARCIPHQCPHNEPPRADPKLQANLKVHRSVQTRRAATDARGRPYINRAPFHTEPEWVD